jgi:hypothetical protein
MRAIMYDACGIMIKLNPANTPAQIYLRSPSENRRKYIIYPRAITPI